MDAVTLKRQHLEQIMLIAKYFDTVTKQLAQITKNLKAIRASIEPILPEIHKLSGKIRRH